MMNEEFNKNSSVPFIDDVLNRLIKTEYLLDTTYDQFSYDDFGDLTQIANNDVSYTYAYTARHALSSKTDSRLGKVMRWFYDGVGNVALKVDYQGEATHYQYNSANRLVAERNAAYLQVSYHYDGAGRLIDRILSNGAQTSYQYDADNRLIGLKNKSANKTIVEALSYQRDNIGNITAITNATSGKTIAYVYDALYRLTTVDANGYSEDRTYTYDKVGNRRSHQSDSAPFHYIYSEAGYDAPPQGNRLLEIRWGIPTGALVQQFSYDDAGRLLMTLDESGTLLYMLGYNGKGRVSAIVTPSTGLTFMGYDANDHRIKKGDKLYHLEGENLEASYDSAGNLTDKYLRGVVVDEIVNGFHYNNPDDVNDWVNYTFHHDHLNSVTALSGHAGSIEETTMYDPYGKPLSLTIPGTGNDMLYTGREYDRETGLYYYRARFYDPNIGRFVSEDPLGFKAGVNFYAYVGNNPVNFNDPMGMEPGDFFDLNNWGLARGKAIAGQVFNEAKNLAIQKGNGDINKANLLFTNGQVDAWRHAEWQRRTAEEMNPTFAWLVGTQHEIKNLADWTGEWWNGTNKINLTQQLQENFMDLSNNFVGINAENNGVSRISYDNPLLTFGAGGINGQPDTGFLGYNAVKGLSGISVADPVLLGSSVGGSAGGGFVLYPNKPNTNIMRTVYSK